MFIDASIDVDSRRLVKISGSCLVWGNGLGWCRRPLSNMSLLVHLISEPCLNYYKYFTNYGYYTNHICSLIVKYEVENVFLRVNACLHSTFQIVIPVSVNAWNLSIAHLLRR